MKKLLLEALQNYETREFGETSYFKVEDIPTIIPMAYTNTGNEMYEVQVNFNLEKLRWEEYINNELIQTDDRNSLEEFIDEIDCISFDDVVRDILFKAEELEEEELNKKSNKMIKGILVHPNCPPMVVEFNNTLENMQSLVGGMIESVYVGQEENIDVFVNEEGKLIGLEANKYLLSPEGHVLDVLVGNILILGADLENGDTISIPDNKIKKYFEMFLKTNLVVGG